MALEGILHFTKAERKRLAAACMVIGIKFPEFVHTATMQALDEHEGGESAATKIRREIAQCDKNVRPAALVDYKSGLQMALAIVEGRA
jgi:hypothetical protein